MVRLAATRRAQVSLDIEFLTQPAECIPLEDGSVDTVVSTFTLCTIPAVDQALSSIARVLRPDGLLVFLENSWRPTPTSSGGSADGLPSIVGCSRAWC